MPAKKSSKPSKTHVGTITILVSDREKNSSALNQLLSEQGNLIMARMGVNLQRACIDHCFGMITVAVEGPAKEINALAKKIDKLYGIKAKAVTFTN